MRIKKINYYLIKLMRGISSKFYLLWIGRNVEGVSVEEKVIQTRAGRTKLLYYTPKNINKVSPVFVSIHGGGFVFGNASIDTFNCKRIAKDVKCVVVNIDYKLSPESPFPKALCQCYDTIKWLVDNCDKLNIDKNRIAVGGHSSGGNLAAAVCILAKEKKEFSIVYQVLDYPLLDLFKNPYSKLNRPKGLNKIAPWAQKLFNESYIPYHKAKSPLASPIFEDDLKGLPPALIITAEKDMLVHEGKKYAEKLKAAGVQVTYRNYKGAVHAFNYFSSRKARDSWKLIEDKLKEALKNS